MQDLDADLDLETNAGNIFGKFNIENDLYTFNFGVKNLDLTELTAGSLYDTLARTDLDDLYLSVEGSGKNLDSLDIATGFAEIVIQDTDSEDPGLIAEADLSSEGLNADIVFDDVAGEAVFQFFTDLNNTYRAEGNFVKLDFTNIPYVRYPIVMNGKFFTDVRYDSLSDMTADVNLRDFDFRYQREKYALDTLNADVNFAGAEKSVLVKSDWVDADVKGNFSFDEIFTRVQEEIFAYIREDYASNTVYAENANLNAEINWRETEILTSGIIPGLEEIKPFQLNASFASAQDKMSADLNFPLIVYSGVRITDFTGDASTAAESLKYDFVIDNLKLSAAQNLGTVKLNGGVTNGTLIFDLLNIDTTGATNLSLIALTDFSDERYRLRFDQEAIFKQ